MNSSIIGTCQPGSMRTIDEAGCIPCPEGTYNDLPYQKVCKTCPDGTWTKWIGALSSTECLSKSDTVSIVHYINTILCLSSKCKSNQRCLSSYFKSMMLINIL